MDDSRVVLTPFGVVMTVVTVIFVVNSYVARRNDKNEFFRRLLSMVLRFELDN